MKKSALLLSSVLLLCGCSVVYGANSSLDGPNSSRNVIASSSEKPAMYHLAVAGIKDASLDLPKRGHYQSGEMLSFSIEIVTDVTFKPFLNGSMLESVRDDAVVGGYAYYEFEMPCKDSILEIKADKFSEDRFYSFGELFEWAGLLNEGNVKGIRIESESIGVDPQYVHVETQYSEDARDISYNLDLLNEPLAKTDVSSEGGWLKRVFFVTENGEYRLTVESGILIWDDCYSFQRFCCLANDSTPSYLLFEINYE